MMEGLRQWLLGIVLTAFAAGLAMDLAPKGREQAYVRMVGGLLLMLALLGPLGTALREETVLPAGGFSSGVRETAEGYREKQRLALAEIIEERTEAYICDKAEALGLAVEVRVETAPGEGEIPLPAAVYIRGPYSDALGAAIQKEVGIPAEKQIWQEDEAWSEKEKAPTGS